MPDFAILAFVSLITVINPVGAVPLYVSLTTGKSPLDRAHVALRACLIGFVALGIFALAGGALFALFGITVPAFQIAGGILFALMAIRSLQGNDDDRAEAAAAEDALVVPLAIPIIVGPGAISTVVVLSGQTTGFAGRLVLVTAAGIALGVTYVVLLAAPWLVAHIGKNTERVVNKMMGLILCVIGVQMILDGGRTVVLELVAKTRAIG